MINGIPGNQTSDTLVEDLEGRTSKLQEVTESFLHATQDGTMETKIVCFYETLPTQILNTVLPKKLALFVPFTNYIVSDHPKALG